MSSWYACRDAFKEKQSANSSWTRPVNAAHGAVERMHLGDNFRHLAKAGDSEKLRTMLLDADSSAGYGLEQVLDLADDMAHDADA